jgi:hypothetical protein
LLLHEAERLSFTVIGANTSDLVQGLMEPPPLTLDLLIARDQFRQGLHVGLPIMFPFCSITTMSTGVQQSEMPMKNAHG